MRARLLSGLPLVLFCACTSPGETEAPTPPAGEEPQAALATTGTRGGGKGCDDEGTKPFCSECQGAQACIDVCVGFDICVVEHTEGGRSCTAHKACTTGNSFGGLGVLAEPVTEPPAVLEPGDVVGPRLTTEEAVATQERLRAYFHTDVMPWLRECWGDLEGQGHILIRHHYEQNDEGRWAPASLESVESSLAEDQYEGVLGCMHKAVDGTSFPVGEWDRGQDEFVLYWKWPVPLPTDY